MEGWGLRKVEAGGRGGSSSAGGGAGRRGAVPPTAVPPAAWPRAPACPPPLRRVVPAAAPPLVNNMRGAAPPSMVGPAAPPPEAPSAFGCQMRERASGGQRVRAKRRDTPRAAGALGLEHLLRRGSREQPRWRGVPPEHVARRDLRAPTRPARVASAASQSPQNPSGVATRSVWLKGICAAPAQRPS